MTYHKPQRTLIKYTYVQNWLLGLCLESKHHFYNVFDNYDGKAQIRGKLSSFMNYYRFATRVTRRVALVEQEQHPFLGT
jgi:hypothetical protein